MVHGHQKLHASQTNRHHPGSPHHTLHDHRGHCTAFLPYSVMTMHSPGMWCVGTCSHELIMMSKLLLACTALRCTQHSHIINNHKKQHTAQTTSAHNQRCTYQTLWRARSPPCIAKHSCQPFERGHQLLHNIQLLTVPTAQ